MQCLKLYFIGIFEKLNLLDLDESPSVISLILFNKKGVISAPLTFFWLKNNRKIYKINKLKIKNLASSKANFIASFTFKPSASCFKFKIELLF